MRLRADMNALEKRQICVYLGEMIIAFRISAGMSHLYFPHLSRPALEPTQPPVQWVLGLSRG